MAIKVLLQTTIVPAADDWSIARFHLLSHFLSQQQDASGNALFDVTARDRESNADDPGKGRAIAESSFHHFTDYNWLGQR
jgi:hypothetical protein